MKLTRRQQEFIRNLLDLYRENKGPIHYTTLAERVGVSQITAYDMLRLLEEKGFVRSDYQLASDKAGPGRSAVVFWPSQRAHQRFAEVFQELGVTDWDTFRERFLEQLACREPFIENERGIIKAIFTYALPDGPPSLQFCAEVIVVIASRLHSPGERDTLLASFRQLLPDLERPSAVDLSLFGGFALGLLASQGEDDDQLSDELTEHIRQYFLLVSGMDLEIRRRLAVKLVEILEALSGAADEDNLSPKTIDASSTTSSRFGVAHESN
ncbi:MAG: Lrp/AsnC family transcriptional regulator [Caldilineales bacterium]|nr:Lrp/AsnC family transcriptional regulator [Caldilineales bacterium]